MKSVSFLIAVLFAATSSIFAQNISPEEMEKQKDFKKLYGSNDPKEQLKGIELFEGATHPSSRQILTAVVSTAQSTEVRNAAFSRLAQMPATDPGHSLALANLFRQLKPSDVEGKVAFARAMKASEFKYSIYEALSEYGSKLRYPDLFTGEQKGKADPNTNNKRQRKEFEDFVAAFKEAVPEATIKVSDRNAPVEFRKWFDLNKTSVMKKDRELAEKYFAEAREKAGQTNTLIINKKDETGAVAEKKEGAAEEKKDEAKKPE